MVSVSECIENQSICSVFEKEQIKGSNVGNVFIVQVADYVANALYSKYEFGNSIYNNLLESNLGHVNPYQCVNLFNISYLCGSH